jgi:hypothetical protein
MVKYFESVHREPLQGAPLGTSARQKRLEVNRHRKDNACNIKIIFIIQKSSPQDSQKPFASRENEEVKRDALLTCFLVITRRP